MTAIVVLGARGLVGAWVARAASSAGHDVTALTKTDVDLASLDAPDRVLAIVRGSAARAVVIAAGVASVEGCERDPQGTRAINVMFPARLSRALAEDPSTSGVRMVAFSSEYVFAGPDPAYTEYAERKPLNAYGRQKCELEDALMPGGHLVLRTSAVFDVEEGRKNFVYQLVDAARSGRTIKVADDQLVTPTLARDLAAFVVVALAQECFGLWHVAGPRVLERVAFARLAARAFGIDEARAIEAMPTSSIGLVAHRPRAGLDTTRAQQLSAGILRDPERALAAMRADFKEAQ
jgi:dTDP-4-dehydrorhamnose reductase